MRVKVNVLIGAACWPGLVTAPLSVFYLFAGDDEDDEDDPLAPMITWKDFQRLMPWEIVILVGGGYALAAGCKVGFCKKKHLVGF